MKRRIVHQRLPAGLPLCDDGTLHWTEITLPLDELLGMLGCASGSILISMLNGKFGASLVLTVDEHLEATPCPLASSAVSSGEPASG